MQHEQKQPHSTAVAILRVLLPVAIQDSGVPQAKKPLEAPPTTPDLVKCA